MSLQYDPTEAIAAISKADKKLAKVIRLAGPFTLQPEPLQSPFQALARAIVFQQLSGKAAQTIHTRLVQALGGARKFRPQTVLEAPEPLLRSAGVSRAKAAALQDLSAKTLDGTVPTLAQLRRMDDQQIVARLTQVRGIGVWTVEMLLIFRLGRPDVFPVVDLGVRKGFMLLHKQEELPRADALTAAAERWRPYRSVASWYLWRAVELLGK